MFSVLSLALFCKLRCLLNMCYHVVTVLSCAHYAILLSVLYSAMISVPSSANCGIIIYALACSLCSFMLTVLFYAHCALWCSVWYHLLSVLYSAHCAIICLLCSLVSIIWHGMLTVLSFVHCTSLCLLCPLMLIVVSSALCALFCKLCSLCQFLFTVPSSAYCSLLWALYELVCSLCSLVFTVLLCACCTILCSLWYHLLPVLSSAHCALLLLSSAHLCALFRLYYAILKKRIYRRLAPVLYGRFECSLALVGHYTLAYTISHIVAPIWPSFPFPLLQQELLLHSERITCSVSTFFTACLS